MENDTTNQMIQSHCDYIMAEDRREFRAVNITNPRLFNSDHLAVIGVPQASYKSENKEYTKKHIAFPLQLPRGHGNQADQLQKQLIREARQAMPPPPAPRDGWI
jgi:hypothetical protein